MGEIQGEILNSLVVSIKKLETFFKKEFNLDVFLTWGTLLGAVREGDFIHYDIDVDLAYLSQQTTDYEISEEHELIVRVLDQSGFPVQRNSKGQIHVKVKPETIESDSPIFNLDLWTTWIRNNKFFHYPDIKGEIAANALLPLKRQHFRNELFWVPANYDQVLTQFYGTNWRIPDKDYKWFPRYDTEDEFEFLRSSAHISSIPDFPLKSDTVVIDERENLFFISGPTLTDEQRLNPTAMLILELCNGKNSPQTIIQLIQSTYQLETAPEVVVLEFLSNAAGCGLIFVSDDSKK